MCVCFFVCYLQKLSEDIASAAGPSTVTDDQDEKDGDKDTKKKKNRCGVCRKKLGLTGNFYLDQFDTITQRDNDDNTN